MACGERNKILKRDYDLLSDTSKMIERKSLLNSKSDDFTKRKLSYKSYQAKKFDGIMNKAFSEFENYNVPTFTNGATSEAMNESSAQISTMIGDQFSAN